MLFSDSDVEIDEMVIEYEVVGDEYEVDLVLFDIFESEIEIYLQILKDYLVVVGDKMLIFYIDDLVCVLYIFKGSVYIVGIVFIVVVIMLFECFVKEFCVQNKCVDCEVVFCIVDVCGFLIEGLVQICVNLQVILFGIDVFLIKFDWLVQEILYCQYEVNIDELVQEELNQLVQLFFGEGFDIVLDVEQIFEQW